MKSLRSIQPSVWILYAGLAVACTSPVWGVAYFVNQDGSAHIESAYLMTEVLRGNPIISETYILNSICIPNSSVHIILALLLQIFTAFTATKIVVCGLFAGVVGAVGWLRFMTVGIDGLKTSLLIGSVVGFNWLWLSGSYNFIFSVIIFAFTLGLYWEWRERLSLGRAAILTLLLIVAYFSHIMGFLILAGSLIVLALRLEKSLRFRTLVITLACLLPIVPLAIWYAAISNDGSRPSPVWRSLADPYSFASWFTQIRSADAFVLISKTAFPFVETRHVWFGALSPALWMIAALTLLLFVTIRRRPIFSCLSSRYLPFAILLLISILLAMFGPDDFGLSRGGIIRERIVICGVVFVVPLFRAAGSTILKRTAQILLILVIFFQLAAVWDYSMRSTMAASEYVAAGRAMNGLRSIASVTVYREHPRFHSTPETQLNLYNSIGNTMVAWDNYECGYFLFPIRNKSKADNDFTQRLASSNVFMSDDSPPVFAERLAGLDSALANDDGRLDALLVWSGRPDVDEVIWKYFEITPFYESLNLRLFRRKKMTSTEIKFDIPR